MFRVHARDCHSYNHLMLALGFTTSNSPAHMTLAFGGYLQNLLVGHEQVEPRAGQSEHEHNAHHLCSQRNRPMILRNRTKRNTLPARGQLPLVTLRPNLRCFGSPTQSTTTAMICSSMYSSLAWVATRGWNNKAKIGRVSLSLTTLAPLEHDKQ